MASLQRHAPPWAQTTIGILMATLWACAPPPEHELAPTLGSGPPLADTGDSPADDPEGDDPEGDDPEGDDSGDEGGAPEDDTASSGSGSESGDETSGTSGSGEPCDGCEPPDDPCADAGQSDTDACEREDPCAAGMYGDGPYCGESIGGTAETLYLCAGGATTATSACDFGCAQCDPFEPDVCKSFAGQQDAAACE